MNEDNLSLSVSRLQAKLVSIQERWDEKTITSEFSDDVVVELLSLIAQLIINLTLVMLEKKEEL